jgi:hypothetical protein
MEVEEEEEVTTSTVDDEADGGATQSPCGTTAAVDADAQAASGLTRNVVSMEPCDDSQSTTCGEENRSGEATACSEVNKATQSDGFDSRKMLKAVENNEAMLKSTNVEESFGMFYCQSEAFCSLSVHRRPNVPFYGFIALNQSHIQCDMCFF